jgi:hypothetical protein
MLIYFHSNMTQNILAKLYCSDNMAPLDAGLLCLD